MAFPPPVLPINRTDATAQQTTHANDHNAISQAVNDTVADVVRRPGRMLALVERTTPAGPTGPANISDLAITFTLATGRLVSLECYGRGFAADTASMDGALQIRRSSDSAVVADGQWSCGSRNIGNGTYLAGAVHVQRTITLAAGTYTYSVWLAPTAGLVTMSASGNQAAWIAAFDVGSST
jgi:hypothetical protein